MTTATETRRRPPPPPPKPAPHEAAHATHAAHAAPAAHATPAAHEVPFDKKTVDHDVQAAARLRAQASGARANPFADHEPTGSGVRRGLGANSSAHAKKQMSELEATAKAASEGKSPDGMCLSHVQDFLQQTKFGDAGSVPRLPEAHDFADYLNKGDNASKMGLQKLDVKNPYDAPPGAIVVVAAGSPGTSHPTAGDIAVRGEGDHFYNGGEMGYGPKADFEKNGGKVLGVYVPKGGASSSSSSKPSAPSAAGPAPLAEGDEGKRVETLQRTLDKQGFHSGPVDGIYGPKTAAAVQRFNDAAGIDADSATRATQEALHPVAAAQAVAAQDRVHAVEPGERLDGIARKENVSVALLRQANPVLDRQQTLQAGQKLFVPAVDLKAAPHAAYDPNENDPTAHIGAPPPGADPADWRRAPGAVPPTTSMAKDGDRVHLQGLQQGDSGERVAALQGALARRGYDVGEKGKLDDKTAAAVAQFHQDQGLEGGKVATVTDQRHLFAAQFLYGKSAGLDKEAAAPAGDVKLPPEPGAPFGKVDLSTAEGKKVFAEAAKLAGVPKEWADSPALASLVNAESGGIVGRPNYTYGSRAADSSQWKGIVDELHQGRITTESSATGLGQLLLDNVDKYYPKGRKGIGDPVQEAAGMLGYIKDRYGSPEVAWGNHSANPSRYAGVPVLYSGEGY